ncbi:hypothetical protein BKA80DRAFT_42763 [Phyllosticta citrichinensis]
MYVCMYVCTVHSSSQINQQQRPLHAQTQRICQQQNQLDQCTKHGIITVSNRSELPRSRAGCGEVWYSSASRPPPPPPPLTTPSLRTAARRESRERVTHYSRTYLPHRTVPTSDISSQPFHTGGRRRSPRPAALDGQCGVQAKQQTYCPYPVRLPWTLLSALSRYRAGWAGGRIYLSARPPGSPARLRVWLLTLPAVQSVRQYVGQQVDIFFHWV